MRFSDFFGLSRDQAELDFVDVDLDTDLRLFVDPFNFSQRSDAWSVECHNDIVSYFQLVIDSLKKGDDQTAKYLLGNLNEPNETRLGYSKGVSQGRGIGKIQASNLFDNLKSSKAAISGLLSDITDCEIFVEGVGLDKISDITTNILRGKLIAYTQDQCMLHGVPLKGTVASGKFWNPISGQWEQTYVQMPVASGRRIILVPKASVRRKPGLSSDRYYSNAILHFLEADEIDKNSGLVRVLKSGRRKVAKKDLSRKYPASKSYIRTFTENHPEIYQKYKASIGVSRELTNEELEEGFDEPTFSQKLIEALSEIETGTGKASDFHGLMIGTLEFLFYPDLIYPKKEDPISDGRKRIDITYTNSSTTGFFYRRRLEPTTQARIVIVECKNYNSDPSNPELDQISGRFSPTRGRFGLLVCRSITNEELMFNRCKDTARDDRGYVVPLSDRDVIAMLGMIRDGDRNEIDSYLEGRFRRLLR